MSGFRKPVLPLCYAELFQTSLRFAGCFVQPADAGVVLARFSLQGTLGYPLPLKDILTQVETPWAFKMAVGQGKERTRTRACCLMAIGGCSVLSR